MSNIAEYIYVLFHKDPLLGNNLFYVGRTNNPERRLKEHKYLSKFSHEDKYQYIRELDKKGLPWSLKVIAEVDLEEAEGKDYERYYVIKFIRDGYVLTNMKHGDILKNRVLSEMSKDYSIDSPSAVKSRREKMLLDIAESKSKRLMLKILSNDKTKEEIFKNRVENLKNILSTYGYVDFILATGMKKSKLEGLLNNKPVKGKHDAEWVRNIEDSLVLPEGWMDSVLSVNEAQDELNLIFKNRYDKITWLEMINNGGYVNRSKDMINFISKNEAARISLNKESLEEIALRHNVPLEYLNTSMPELKRKTRNIDVNKGRLQNLMLLVHKAGGLENFANIIGVDDKVIYEYLKSFPRVSKPIMAKTVRKLEERFSIESGEMDYELVRDTA